MKNVKTMFTSLITFLALAAVVSTVSLPVFAQDGLPEPGPARPSTIPAVKETKLKNGLVVAVVEKSNVPLVTVQLLVRSGAAFEGPEKAGLADITASMLTKGTKTRTATQIAEQIEFLGGSINSSAGWNSSTVTVSVTSDKLDQAMAILADVILNPIFPQSELDLLKTQAIDELTYNLTQPGFLSNYVSSVYAFDEHPAGGTVSSLQAITQKDVATFYKDEFLPTNAVLIFAGDINSAKATAAAKNLFAKWKTPKSAKKEIIAEMMESPPGPPSNASNASPVVSEILVIDLPSSGQASVSYANRLPVGRVPNDPKANSNKDFYVASTLNSLLGGGYSSRLNQEIRIKRGLSYGAGSSFIWRWDESNFSTRTQTKNESAPEVAEIVIAELKRLAADKIAAAELDPRKAVLTGGFSRNIETTGGLVAALSDLYTFEIPTTELNAYSNSVNLVADESIRDFAKANLLGGSVIIVGDYAKFKDDLAKRFPDVKLTVVKAGELDVSQPNLLKK